MGPKPLPNDRVFICNFRQEYMDQEKKKNYSLDTASPWLARNRNDEIKTLNCVQPTVRQTRTRCVRVHGWFCEQKHGVLITQEGGLWVLIATFTIALTQRVGASATAAQAAIHPPRPTLHAINTGGAAGSATPNVNPAPA